MHAALMGLLCLAAPAPAGGAAPADPIPYFKGGKWGYSDAARHLVVPAVYDKAGRFTEGRALVEKGQRKGFIDPTGREVVPLRYAHAEPFSEGRAAVGESGAFGSDHFGFVDREGQVVIPLRYDSVNSFAGGLAKVEMGQGSVQHWGFVDAQGREVVPPDKYAYVGSFSEDVAPVFEEHEIDIERFGFVDRQGREVIPVSRHWSGCHERWAEGRMAIRHKGKWGYIDHAGHEVIPTVYDEAGDFDQGQAPVKMGGQDFFIDPAGQRIASPLPYRPEADGLREVAAGSKRTWVDRTGKVVIPARYDQSRDEVCPDWPLREGLRGVTLDGKHGFIDRKGVEVIPVQYDCTGYPSEGRVAVWQKKLAGFFDLSGKQVIPFRYWKAEPFQGGLAGVALPVQDGLWVHGYIDTRGTEYFEGPGER